MGLTIKYGNVAPKGPQASRYTADADKYTTSVWTDYMIHNRYEKDPHIWMHGVTSPNGFNGSSAAFTQSASPTLLWCVDWTACRFGVKPNAPDPNAFSASNSRWQLLWEDYDFPQETVAANAFTALWRWSGRYWYGCLNPSTLTADDMCWPRPPWLTDDQARNVPSNLFQSGLADNLQVDEPVVRQGPGVPRR